MTFFPTEQWLAEYGRRLERSDMLDDLATGWGVGFDGDIRLVVDDIPLGETTLGDLPEGVFGDMPEAPRESLSDVTLAESPSLFDGHVRSALPETTRDLLVQLDENIVDRALHVHIELSEGVVGDVEVLDAPDAREAGVVMHGPLSTWQAIVDGRPALSAILSGDLQVQGNMVRVARYGTMLQHLGKLAADIEATHLFPTSRQPIENTVLDAATRPPVRVQRTAERQARRTLNTLSPF